MSGSGPGRLPKIGDIVIYHETVRQDIWDPLQLVSWPAIVTAVVDSPGGHPLPRLRLTAFRPYEKPLWEITADYSPKPEPHHWSWPEREA
jgi:hypothetical protein